MNDISSTATSGAAEADRLFRRPLIVGSRPLILGGLSVARRLTRVRWEPHGIERLTRLDPPLLFAANHVSHADTAAILGTLPRPFRGRTAVAAALDVFGSGDGLSRQIPRRLLTLVVAAGFHAFAFDRHGSALASMRAAVRIIRNNWNLLLYPEGQRSRSGEMGPFKAGVGVLARLTGRPVIPVHVDGGQQILPCGAFMPRPGRLVVRYGEPLWHERGESADKFARRLRDDVRSLGRGSSSRASWKVRNH